MGATVQTLVSKFADRIGVPYSASVVQSTDSKIKQMVGLVEEVLEDLTKPDNNFQALIREALFTTVAGENQGVLTTIADEGFKAIINETIFNRTLRLPVFGPIDPQLWQGLKSLPNSGPFYKYRIRGGNLLFNPPAVAGHICAFEYRSFAAVVDGEDPSILKQYISRDSDTFVFDDSLIIQGLKWKWKYENGLDYAEDLSTYEQSKAAILLVDGAKRTVNMAGADRSFRPGLFVPSGNWNLP